MRSRCTPFRKKLIYSSLDCLLDDLPEQLRMFCFQRNVHSVRCSENSLWHQNLDEGLIAAPMRISWLGLANAKRAERLWYIR